VLFLALAVQLHRPFAPLHVDWDSVIFWACPVPAVVDWSIGQLTTWRGSNALRVLSGALLGVALGRTVYVNMRHPGDPRVLVEVLGLSAIAGVVWGVRQVLGYGPTSSS
jgi:hypothetical protein